LGIFRLLLAMCVLFGHAVPFGPLNYLDGTFAVESFFVISGFYMAYILSEKYTRERLGKSYVRKFYLSRYLRLYPAYLLAFILFLALQCFAAALFHSPVETFVDWKKLLALPPTANNLLLLVWAVLSNLTIFLQDWGGVIAVRAHQAIFTLDRHLTEIYAWALTVTNVAWSLGVELAFYLAAPYLLRRSDRQLFVLALLGLVLKICAVMMIHNDLPYRMLPFVFVNFLAGVLAYRKRAVLIESLGKHTALICYCLMLAITTALPKGWSDWAYSFTVIGVTAFIVPILFDYSKNVKWDNRIGELSYPFYLLHIMVLDLVHFVITKRLGIVNTYVVSACDISLTVLCSYLVLWLEARYLEPYRQALGRPASGVKELLRPGGAAEPHLNTGSRD
jgi:peptidoglycan/LPS O-acetylase OafA/YrhL